MKKHVLAVVLFLVALSMSSQKKSALIIANSDYNRSKTGWRELHCAKDTELIKTALIKSGFAAQDIHVAYNVTKEQMLVALRQYSQQLQPGDFAFLHYSGHGQLVQDLNGDEVNGFDQALVPLDAPSCDLDLYDYKGSAYKNVYRGEKHLIDDELDTLLTDMRHRLGSAGFLFVSIDACHSNTATKSVEAKAGPERGSSFKWMINDAMTAYAGKSFDSEHGMGLTRAPEENKGADMFCIYASSQNDANNEYYDGELQCGSLSLALSKALANTNALTSYRSIYYRVKSNMSNMPGVYNTPDCEGALDKIVFGGKSVQEPFHFRVSKVVYNPASVVIDGGTLFNLFSGDSINLYVSETLDTSKTQPLAIGVIDAVNSTNASVRLISFSPELIGKLENGWAYVRTPHYLLVRLENFDPVEKQVFESLCQKSNTIRIAPNKQELNIKRTPTGYELSENGNPVFFTTSALDTVFYKLEDYRRYQALLSLTNDLPLNAELKMFRDTGAGKTVPLPPGGQIKIGERIGFRIVNHSIYSLYFMLVELSPERSAAVALPKTDKQTGLLNFSLCNMDAQDSLTLFKADGKGYWWRVTRPAGKYKFRLLVSTVPFDQSFITGFYSNDAQLLAHQTYGTDKAIAMKDKGGTLKNTSFSELIISSKLHLFDLEYEAVSAR